MSAPPLKKPVVTEREARQVAEAAREQAWRKPSFAKELFLGRFRLDLIHPHPLPTDEAVRRGEQFLTKLRDFCETKVDGALIEREARIPDEVINGLKELGALGMKIDPKYGGLGLTQVYYNKALALVGSASPAIGVLLSAHQSIGAPQPLKLFGTPNRRRSSCRAAPAPTSAPSSSPNPTSARTRPASPPARCPTGTTTSWTV